ncbi:MAG TPA: hypothetical protein VG873_14750 [Burkholderiales bacterium]|nr:hypothetical protein [Burkholderiales bacterium]
MTASRRAEHRVEESVFSLFQEIPALCGFTVALRTDGLELADIGLFPAPADDEARLIHAEIRDALSALLEEQPEAHRLLSGRTFARALH